MRNVIQLGTLITWMPGMELAERQGFEPWIEFPLYTLSKRAPSATRPSLRWEARRRSSAEATSA